MAGVSGPTTEEGTALNRDEAVSAPKSEIRPALAVDAHSIGDF